MYEKTSIAINTEKLRDDMKAECLGAYYGGGFGGALNESFDIDCATPDRLVKMAQQQGINLRKYEV